MMALLTREQCLKLLENGLRQEEARMKDECLDFEPVVKFFTPDAGCTWLLTELYPDEPDIAFGLCDLGMGFPELGDVSLFEISEIRGRLGLPVERDRGFTPQKTISEYAKEAREVGQIVT